VRHAKGGVSEQLGAAQSREKGGYLTASAEDRGVASDTCNVGWGMTIGTGGKGREVDNRLSILGKKGVSEIEG